jgi:hypothetical protein
MTKVSRWLGGLLGAAIVTCCGCSETVTSPESASTAKASVKGKVTLDGKPLAKATIRFSPANANRKSAPSAAATIADDGTYEVTTLVGENSVTLGGPPIAKNTTLMYFTRGCDLKEGDNTFDLTLP